MSLRFSLRLAVALAAWALLGPAVQAGEFSVTPVRLEFGAGMRTQLLSITNTGTTPARFLVRGAAWTMNEAGGVVTSDSDTLVVFPASFALAPKATQNIRVGTAERPGEDEKTWRVVLEEVPDATAPPPGGATINVLSMISVPVFMRPLAPRHALDLAWGGAAGTTARVTLANGGNVTELVGSVSVAPVRGGQAQAPSRTEGWYVLPGKRRVYAFEQSGGWCAPGVTGFQLVALDVQGQPMASRTVDASEACR
ncbi:MAG: hypothetical protein EOO24_64845 [Comamonadaceae bacterium]|nr:MAG: hypothetical protein EOO24_64845 [Comamonadaceae bacterium]